jgi:hypothetical protein
MSCLSDNPNLLWLLSGLSILMFVGSLILIPLLVVRVPEDYFIRQPIKDWPTRHPLVHLSIIAAKNLLGGGMLLAGIAMLVLPGQGLLTILIALMLIDFPYKRYWERRMIGIKPVREAANWIRRKNGHPPLVLEPKDESAGRNF